MTPVEFCRRMLADAVARDDFQTASHYEALLKFWEKQP